MSRSLKAVTRKSTVRRAERVRFQRALPGAKRNLRVAESTGMPEWLAKDRCPLTFADKREVQARRAALWSFVRQWIRWI